MDELGKERDPLGQHVHEGQTRSSSYLVSIVGRQPGERLPAQAAKVLLVVAVVFPLAQGIAADAAAFLGVLQSRPASFLPTSIFSDHHAPAFFGDRITAFLSGFLFVVVAGGEAEHDLAHGLVLFLQDQLRHQLVHGRPWVPVVFFSGVLGRKKSRV